MAGVGLAIAGLAISGASAGMGFAQASKARKLAAQENKKADRLMQEARDKAEKNIYEGLSVPMEAYNREFRENTAQQMQNVQSLQEAGGRTLAAGIGKVAGQGTMSNQDISVRLGQAVYDNEKMKADASQDVNQQLIKMDVGQSSSARRAAADLKTEAAQATSGAIESVGSAVSYGAALAPLFPSKKDAKGNKLTGQELIDAKAAAAAAVGNTLQAGGLIPGIKKPLQYTGCGPSKQEPCDGTNANP